MFCNPGTLAGAFLALGLSSAVAPSAAADSPPPGLARTDVKIAAKDIDVRPLPGGPHALTVRSLVPAHAIELHQYVATPDTEQTQSRWVESNARTDVKIEPRVENVASTPDAGPPPLTVRSLSPAHAVEVHPFVEAPDTDDTHSLRVESK